MATVFVVLYYPDEYSSWVRFLGHRSNTHRDLTSFFCCFQEAENNGAGFGSTQRIGKQEQCGLVINIRCIM